MLKQKYLNRACMVLLFAGLAISSTASAHTSYMKPNVFSTTRGNMVTLQCSFTEDFANPDFVVKSDDWHYYTPDGKRHDYDSITSLKQVSILEQSIEKEGTYRFSTGVRYGRKGKGLTLKDGTKKPLFGEAAKNPIIPEGAKITTSQTVTVADVYVTKGSPTNTVVKKTIGRLVLTPSTHPNELFMDEAFNIKVTFDGKKLKNQKMTVYRESGKFDSDKGKIEFETNSKGIAKIDLKRPGVYLIYTRHKADAPATADVDVHSFTTSLTFEVTP